MTTPPAPASVPRSLPPALAATTRRNPWLLGGVAAAALLGAIVNAIGMLGFPYNAPVEQLYAIGISIDLLAIAVACGIGAALAARHRFRPGSNAIAIVALGFAVLTLLVWAVAGGSLSVVQLLTERGRYMDATGGLFLTGGLWVIAAVFGAHTIRRGEGGRNRLFATLALVLVGALVGFAVASSIIYGLGLTD